MSKQKQLERKQDCLQTRLTRNLVKRRTLDVEINREFEELKRIEVSIEISSEQQSFRKQTEISGQRADHDWTIATHV